MPIEQILSEVVERCTACGATKVILFGSFAKGNASRGSDVDIAVDGDFDYFDLKDDIETIETLRTIDLVDLRTLRNNDLLEEIQRYGKVLYEKI